MTDNAPILSRRNDIWHLGDHRLMCGDSTVSEDVARLMAGDRADLLLTSPPYLNQRRYEGEGDTDWDALMQGVFRHLDSTMASDGQVLVNLGIVHSDGEWRIYWQSWLNWMRERGWRRFAWYVWDQGPGLPGSWHGRLAPSFEFVFHFNRRARRLNKTIPCKHAGSPNHGRGLRKADGSVAEWSQGAKPVNSHRIPDSTIRIGRSKSRGVEARHPAVFPVGLPVHLIEAFTEGGGIVLDPFAGSGTTILAGERTGRAIRAMESVPLYVDLAIRRWRRLHPDIPVTLNGNWPIDTVRQSRLGESA